MTLEILIPAIVSAVVPYLAKGGEKLVEKTVEEGFKHRAQIWQKIRSLYPDNELTTLDLFAENPEDQKLQGKLEGKLEERLTANPEVAKELEELLKSIKPISNNTNVNFQQGKTNINIQGNVNSTANLNQKNDDDEY